jgi:hypothetical protein
MAGHLLLTEIDEESVGCCGIQEARYVSERGRREIPNALHYHV